MPKLIWLAFAVLTMAGASVHAAQLPTDAEIRQTIIQESIAAYRGNCPCPYNSARNGSRCGGRSAYSRPGGASPLCFPQDVTQQMVDVYRREHVPAR
jgi:hypothetical protein